MIPTPQVAVPLSDLPYHLNVVRSLTESRLIIAADASGNMLALVGYEGRSNAATLSVLGMANLAATREIARLTETDGGVQTLILESENGGVLICGRGGGLVFMAVLGPNSLLGMTRLELHKLAEIAWVDDVPSDRPAVTEMLSAGVLDELDKAL
jgi:predicted regulator of Ras-like GTPase activity (Roadblock/LC7/MglB family)